jgi:hypothetical protein
MENLIATYRRVVEFACFICRIGAQPFPEPTRLFAQLGRDFLKGAAVRHHQARRSASIRSLTLLTTSAACDELFLRASDSSQIFKSRGTRTNIFALGSCSFSFMVTL